MLILLFAVSPLPAEEEIAIPRLSQAPSLEDFLSMEPSEPFRDAMAQVHGGFIQQEPVEGDPASQETDVYLGYDQKNLYVVFVAFDDQPDRIRANRTRREDFFGDDLVEIQLDTFLDHRRAYTFIVNPLGVQFDAIWTEGNEFDRSFDTIWHSKGRLTDRGYVVWIAIPFKSLRFPAVEEQRWGFFLVRDIPRNTESSSRPRIAKKIQSRLSQEGVLTGMRGISPGRNAQINPYITGRALRLADEGGAAAGDFVRTQEVDGGVDAKMVFRDSLVLDLTANPDFSQVESDEPQITVNERFELFFPEKRPFFLENADAFQTPLNLLFTRRIADPRAGLRLTGKSGSNNLGLLLIDDEAPGRSRPASDPLSGARARIGVLRYARDLFTDSKIGVLYTDRKLGNGRNQVGGVDALFRVGSKWRFSGQAVRSRTRDQGGDILSGSIQDFRLDGSGRHFQSHSHYTDNGKDFRTELGFIPRIDNRNMHQSLTWTFRPEGETVLSWGPSLFAMRIEDSAGLRLDTLLNSEVGFEFRRQTSLEIGYRSGNERLRTLDHPALTRDRDYETREARVEFDSRFSNRWNLALNLQAGRAIHLTPPAGEEPSTVDTTGIETEVTLRPTGGLRFDLTYISRTLDRLGTGERILQDRIARLRFNWQFTLQASLRAILQYDSLSADPRFTSSAVDRNLNADILFTWLQNPWTAFYVGFNSNYVNRRFQGAGPGRVLVPTQGIDLNDGRQLFVKYTYLHRF